MRAQFLVIVAGLATSGHACFDVLDVMHDELQRSFEILQDEEEPPYYLGYEITEDAAMTIAGSFGTVVVEDFVISRFLDVDLRVGDYSMDNNHPIRSNTQNPAIVDESVGATVQVDDEQALRTSLWFRTDAAYKQALIQYSRVKSAVQASVEAQDYPGDFSKARTTQYSMEKYELLADATEWKLKIELYTEPFRHSKSVLSAYAYIIGDVETRWFANSERTRVMVSRPFYRLVIQATAKADDGITA